MKILFTLGALAFLQFQIGCKARTFGNKTKSNSVKTGNGCSVEVPASVDAVFTASKDPFKIRAIDNGPCQNPQDPKDKGVHRSQVAKMLLGGSSPCTDLGRALISEHGNYLTDANDDINSNLNKKVRSVDVYNCGAAGSTDIRDKVFVTGSREVIAFDPVSSGYNYYTSESKEAQLTYHGNSHLMANANELSEPISTHPCTQCHVSGGLVMKELRAPWLNWQTTRRFGNSQLLDLPTQGKVSTSEVPSRPLPGAAPATDDNGIFVGQEMEKVVIQSQILMNEFKIQHLKNAGSPNAKLRAVGLLAPEEPTLKEILRPLFCETETVMATATTPIDTKPAPATVPLPLDLYINRLLIPTTTANVNTIDITKEQRPGTVATSELQISNLGDSIQKIELISRLDVGSGPDREDVNPVLPGTQKAATVSFAQPAINLNSWIQFKKTKQLFVPITQGNSATNPPSVDADLATGRFPFLIPARSFQDDDFISRAVKNGILEENFALSVLMIDFPNPVFSKRRCEMLNFIPSTPISTLEVNNLAKSISTAAVNALKTIPASSALAASGLKELTDLNTLLGQNPQNFKKALADKVSAYSVECSKNPPTPENLYLLLRSRRARWFPPKSGDSSQRFAVEDMVRNRLVPDPKKIELSMGKFFKAGTLDEGIRIGPNCTILVPDDMRDL